MQFHLQMEYHQEPIINNENEALNALKKGMIDVLYIENFRITKI